MKAHPDVTPHTVDDVPCPDPYECAIPAHGLERLPTGPTLSAVDVAELSRPDREWIEILVGELAAVRTSQARARVVQLYEATIVPDTATGPKGDKSLLDLTFDPKNRPASGVDLAKHLAALDLRRRLLEDELQHALGQEEAYLEATDTAGPVAD